MKMMTTHDDDMTMNEDDDYEYDDYEYDDYKDDDDDDDDDDEDDDDEDNDDEDDDDEDDDDDEENDDEEDNDDGGRRRWWWLRQQWLNDNNDFNHADGHDQSMIRKTMSGDDIYHNDFNYSLIQRTTIDVLVSAINDDGDNDKNDDDDSHNAIKHRSCHSNEIVDYCSL